MNKFIKKARPFGEGQPPEQNIAPGQTQAPELPSELQQTNTPSSTPPPTEEAVTEQPEGSTEETGGMDRTPTPETNISTEISVDAATGEITIQRGDNTSFRVAGLGDYEGFESPDGLYYAEPDKRGRLSLYRREADDHIFVKEIDDRELAEMMSGNYSFLGPDKVSFKVSEDYYGGIKVKEPKVNFNDKNKEFVYNEGKKDKNKGIPSRGELFYANEPEYLEIYNAGYEGVEDVNLRFSSKIAEEEKLDSNASDYTVSPNKIPTPDTEIKDTPYTGKYRPGDSIKTRDPDSGVEQYGFVVDIKDNGLYEINYENGTTRTLHEGWLIDAPEAANANSEELFNDDFKTVANLKTATHNDWEDLLRGKVPSYDDEKTYSKDQHDNPFSHPKNRLEAPKFTIKATVPDNLDARSVAYALQTQAMMEVDVNSNTLTIINVSEPLALITELGEYGIEAKTEGKNLTEFDQGMEDFKTGMKVAMVGDFPEMNYYYSPYSPPAQAYVVSKTGSKYVLENNQWGRFEAEEREVSNV